VHKGHGTFVRFGNIGSMALGLLVMKYTGHSIEHNLFNRWNLTIISPL
jgi:hypothetical protein